MNAWRFGADIRASIAKIRLGWRWVLRSENNEESDTLYYF
jgi:hypothetical protein